MQRRNRNVLALKRAKEGYGTSDSPDVDLIDAAFHEGSSKHNRNEPDGRFEVGSSSWDSPAAP